MKKIFSIILCAAVVLTTGCSGHNSVLEENSKLKESSSRSESTSNKVSTNSNTGNSGSSENLKSDESIESEIEEVDKWGVSLDDVDRLAKQAIRKHENIGDYRQDYKKAIRETDDFLEDAEDGKNTEDSWAVFLENYKKSCEAGIEYIKACVDVEFTYNMYTQYGEFTRSKKNAIRFFLTMFNSSIEQIEQSVTDMEELLNPIIEENRKLTDDELEKVLKIYQVLVDKVDIASKSH